MKIAVYAPFKNELQFADRFMASVKAADGVFLTDTGSTDGSPELLEKLGAKIFKAEINPWRFDAGRNVAMANVPEDFDVVMRIDLDEVLPVNWRVIVEAAWTPQTTRLTYRYGFTMVAPGKAGIEMGYGAIHARKGYQWVMPVHELLVADAGFEDRPTACEQLLVEHWSAQKERRTSYRALLELGLSEHVDDQYTSRILFYLGRECNLYGDVEAAVKYFTEFLNRKKEVALYVRERVHAMILLSRISDKLGMKEQRLSWAEKAAFECVDREGRMEAAWANYAAGKPIVARGWAIKAINNKNKPVHYLSDKYSWDEKPFLLLSRCYWETGFYEKAIRTMEIAAQMNPNAELKRDLYAMKKMFLETPKAVRRRR